MTDLNEERAPEADQGSAESSEEVAIIQGKKKTIALKLRREMYQLGIIDLFREVSQHLPHSTVCIDSFIRFLNYKLNARLMFSNMTSYY